MVAVKRVSAKEAKLLKNRKRRKGGRDIKHKCPHCHTRMRLKGKGFDKAWKCPKCGYDKEWRFCRRYV